MASCRQSCPDLQWEGVTGRLGAPYIASEVAYALGAHAALEAYATHYAKHDAVLIACFGDPGLLALREVAAVPTIGLAQASFIAAARLARFAVVTGGKAWGPMLERFARMHQLDTRLVGVFTVDLTGAQIAAAPGRAIESLCAACQEGIAAGAECILLGGAALTGLAGTLQARLGVPVLDNVVLGAKAVSEAIAQVRTPMAHALKLAGPVEGVGAALSKLLT